jgi:hypothetical protein
MGAHPAGAYPIRHIFSSTSASSFSPKLMTDFAAHILKQHAHESVASPPGGLKRTLRPFLKDLAMKFDDLDSIDSKAQAAQSRSLASSAVSQPQDRGADERQKLLPREGVKSNLLQASRQVHNKSNTMQRRARFSKVCKVATVFVVAILIIIIGSVLGVNYSTYNWF